MNLQRLSNYWHGLWTSERHDAALACLCLRLSVRQSRRFRRAGAVERQTPTAAHLVIFRNLPAAMYIFQHITFPDIVTVIACGYGLSTIIQHPVRGCVERISVLRIPGTGPAA